MAEQNIGESKMGHMPVQLFMVVEKCRSAWLCVCVFWCVLCFVFCIPTGDLVVALLRTIGGKQTTQTIVTKRVFIFSKKWYFILEKGHF